MVYSIYFLLVLFFFIVRESPVLQVHTHCLNTCSTFIDGRVPGRRIAPAALFEEEVEEGEEGVSHAAPVDLLGDAFSDSKVQCLKLILKKSIAFF